jgi:hypothetical protein
MSIQVIQLAQYTKKLTLSEYGVLISLASFADKDDGLCWPSLETIAAISNVEKKTAIRAIRRLTAPYDLPDPRPLVSIVENRKVKVRNNTYQLNLPLLQELQESRRKGVPTTPQRKNAVGVATPPSSLDVGVATTPTQVEAEWDIKDREGEIGDQARATSTPSSVISTTTEGDIDDSLYRRTVKEPLLEPKTRTVSVNLSLFGQIAVRNLDRLKNLLVDFGESGPAAHRDDGRREKLEREVSIDGVEAPVGNDVLETLVCTGWIRRERTVSNWRAAAEENGACRQHRRGAAVKSCSGDSLWDSMKIDALMIGEVSRRDPRNIPVPKFWNTRLWRRTGDNFAKLT